jgi:hypothetical protein
MKNKLAILMAIGLLSINHASGGNHLVRFEKIVLQ